MSESIPAPTLWDDAGAPETVYLTRTPAHTTDDGWLVSLDVGSWCPLALGDRPVAQDRNSRDEFLVEVVEVEETLDGASYRLGQLADLDPAAEPCLDATRPWLRRPGPNAAGERR